MLKTLSLRSALITAFIVQIVGAVGLVSYFSFRNGQQAVRDLAKQLMNGQSDRVVESLKTYTATPAIVTQLNETSIQEGKLDLKNIESWGKYFFKQNQQFGVLGYVYFGSAEGEYVEARKSGKGSLRYGIRKLTGPKPRVQVYRADQQGKPLDLLDQYDYDPRVRPWYQTAVMTGIAGWTEIYKFIETPPTLGITFVRPYYDANRKLRGVLGADFVLLEVNESLSRIQVGKSGKIFIIERNGNLVATSSKQQPFTDDQQRIQATALSDPLIQATARYLKQEFGDTIKVRLNQYFEFEWQGKTQLGQMTPFRDRYGLDWLIVMVVPQADFTAQIDTNTQTTAWLCIGALGFAIASSVLMGQWLARPILKLSAVSQNIAKGDFGQSIQARGSRELNVLAASFNHMSSEIQLAQAQLEDYTHSLEEKVRDRTRELEQANAEMHAIFAAMDQLVFVYNRDGRHLKIPAATERKLLYKAGESRQGKTLHDVFDKERADWFLNHILQALDQQETITTEYSLMIEGQEIWSDASISPIDQETVVWIARNITDRKQAEQELKTKNETLSRTLSELQATQTMLIQSEKLAALGQLVAGVAHEMNTPLGAIQSSVENVTEFFEHDLELLPRFLQVISTERQQDFFKLLERSAESFPTLSRLSSREKRQLKRDLTAQLQQQQIAEADVVADTLLDIGIYNDLAPFWDLLRDRDRNTILNLTYQITSLQRSVQTITTATQQASKVVIALKTYSYQGSDTQPVEADVITGIETALTLYQNQLKRGTKVIRQYEEVVPIFCFPDELTQVWTNLIRNAVQAMNYQGKLAIAVSQTDSYIKVALTDTGTGIPPEIQARLFEPFFTTKALGEGSGLGLSIVKKIIEKHRGAIALNSLPGETTFTVTLPIR